MQTILDQKPIRLLEENSFLDYADYAYGQAREGGLSVAGDFLRQFVSMQEGSGLAACKYLHSVNSTWEEDEKEEGDTFQGWAIRESGLSPETIQRNTCVWELLSGDYIPNPYKEKIKSFSLKMLKIAYRAILYHKNNKITGKYDFYESGYNITPEKWLALSESIDDIGVINAVRKINGKKPNSNRVSFKLDDSGDIWFYRGKKDSVVIGQLSVKNPSQLVKDGIAELMERASITERNEY